MAWKNTTELAEKPIISELNVAFYGNIEELLFYRAVKALREAQEQFPDNQEDAAAAVWSTAVSYRSKLVDWLENHQTSISQLEKYQKHFPNEMIKGTKINFKVAGETDELLVQLINGRGQYLLA